MRSPTLIGGLAAEIDGPVISAVLRSWEERFGAVLIAIEPSYAVLSITAPPDDTDQALTLAAERWAFCSQPEGARPDAVQAIAAQLIGEPSPVRLAHSQLTPRLSPLSWHD
jgi:hypothetical protein